MAIANCGSDTIHSRLILFLFCDMTVAAATVVLAMLKTFQRRDIHTMESAFTYMNASDK